MKTLARRGLAKLRSELRRPPKLVGGAVVVPRVLPGRVGVAPAAGRDRAAELAGAGTVEWQVVRVDGRRLVVRFSAQGLAGAPVGRCSPAYRATVEDTSAAVHLTMRALVPPPAPSGEAAPCPGPTHQRTLTVELPTPLAGRALLDRGSGEYRLLSGVAVRQPSYLPPDYGSLNHASRDRGLTVSGGSVFVDHLWMRAGGGGYLVTRQGGPELAALGYRPPALERTTVRGFPATAWKPTRGDLAAGALCLSWVEGQAGFQVCSEGNPAAPLPVGELVRVANGLR